jgi:hypothetical protein
MEDPELLSLRSEVALVDARLGELAASLPESPDEVDRKTWGQLLGLIEQRRRLCDTERRREADLQLHMTANQALALVMALQTAVVECVSNLRERQALGRRVEQLLSRPEPIEAEVDDEPPPAP